ncbi:MAG: hypothetical protein PHQ47_00985 [Candidatus Portnoybacteria bacterium]|nr:hypothetical protein [Candidatus Portnoybacteria bacterium]
MDLIPKTKNSGEFSMAGMKSQGISIYDDKTDLYFLRDKRVLLSFVAIIVFLAAWAGLKAYSVFVLEKKLSAISVEIGQIEAGVDNNRIKKLVELDKTISVAENLLDSHVYDSKFFGMIEKVTLPLVQWSSLSLIPEQGTAQLGGRAASFSVLARQILSFRSSDFTAEISGISLGNEGVTFSALLRFDPGLLREK